MNNSTRLQRFGLSILSGLLLTISFPYTGSLTFVAFFALVPLLIVEHTITVKRYRSRKVFIHAYVTFFIYNLGTTWWIWNADPQGAVMAFVFNSLLMTFAFQLFHFCKKHIGRKEGYIGLILIWVGFEYIHHIWELSWPWLSFGNIFSIHPELVQWYSYTGILGGSAWLLLSNLMILRIIENKYFKKESWGIQTPLFIVYTVILFVPIASSLWTYTSYKEIGEKKEVIVTQPNIDPYNEKFSGLETEDQLNRVITLAQEKLTPKTAVVLAPETAIPYAFNEDVFENLIPYHILTSAMSNWGETELYIGASTQKQFETKRSRASKKDPGGPGFYENYNTSVFIDTKTKPHFVHKSKLVLAAEKVPFSNWFPAMEELSLDLGGTTGTLGIEDEPRIMYAKDFAFAPVICYESVYGEFIGEQCSKGAQVIFIITNDGWWGDTPGYKQHMSFARLRAIENRRWVARSANTGSSCFINQRGDVVEKSNWWVPTSLKQSVVLNSNRTFYSLQGDGMGRAFAFVSVLLVLLAIVRKFKGKRTKEL